MRKLLAVVRREYVQGVRNKGFIVSTLLAPAVMGVLILLPGLLVTMRTGEATRLAVVDQTGRLGAALAEALGRGPAGEAERRPNGTRAEEFEAQFKVERVEPGARPLGEVREELSRRVLENKLDAYLILPPDVLGGGPAQLYARNTGDVFTHGVLGESLNRVVFEERLRAESIDGARVRELSREVEMQRTRVTKGGEQREEGGAGFVFPFLVGSFIVVAILMYGQVILSAVVEEKTTRIVEVLFSSLRAFPLLLGKLVGVSLVGFTQFGIWALMFVSFGLYSGAAAAAASRSRACRSRPSPSRPSSSSSASTSTRRCTPSSAPS